MIQYLKNNRLVRLTFLTLSSILFLTLLSCEKGDKDAGMDILPGGKNLEVKYFDAIDVGAFTMRADSLYATGKGYHSVGRYTDAVFGLSESSFASGFSIPSIDIKAEDSIIILSVVLNLSPQSFFPDTGTMMFDVFPLTRDIKSGAAYTSFDISNHYSAGASVAQTGSIYVSPSKSCKIPLTADFGSNLLSATATNDGTGYFFPGLYIKASEAFSESRVLQVDLTDTARSKMVVEYIRLRPDTTGTKRDTIKANFYPSVSKSANSLLLPENALALSAHQHPASIPVYDAANPYTGLNEEVYIQGMAGLKTQLIFNGLTDWLRLSDRTINKAEVEMNINNYIAADTSLMPRLICFVPAAIEHPEPNSKYWYLGYRQEDLYVSNLTDYVIGLENDTSVKDYGFNIFDGFYDDNKKIADLNVILPTRVVLSNSGENRIRLKITYTNH